jgi:hypothetical protein
MSNKLPRPEKAQRKCIFCDDTRLSREHIFPEWLKNVMFIDPAIDSHYIGRLFSSSDKSKPDAELSFKFQSGHLFSKKLRIVCEKCNGGWMSILQSQTKEILSPLILNKFTSLSKENLIQLSQWIIMATMVADFNDSTTNYTPIAQLKDFKLNRKIPDGWKIYIGNYNGDNKGRYRHIASKLSKIKDIYLQASAFIIGDLFIYILNSDEYNLVNNYRNSYMDKLIQIHPLIESDISSNLISIEYPFKTSINDSDIESLFTLKNFLYFLSPSSFK